MVERILISGVDGSGKSTIARMLMRYLTRRGFRVCYIWFRWRAFLLYALYVYSRTRGLYRPVRRLDGSYARMHFIEADQVLVKLYPYVLTLDLVLAYLLQRFVFLLRRCVITVYDRGPIDVLVDLYYLKRKAGQRLERTLTRFYVSFALKIAGNIIVLTAAESVIAKRKKDLITLTEVRTKSRIYRVLSNALSLCSIDTSIKTVKDTFKEVIACLNSNLRGNPNNGMRPPSCC